MPAKRVEYRTYSGVQPPSLFSRPGRENRSPLQTDPSKKEKKSHALLASQSIN
jgi:hypothetical protein